MSHEGICIGHHSEDEEEDEPGDGYLAPFLAEYQHRDECQGDNPEGTCQFDEGSELQGLLSVGVARAYYRRGIMDGDGCPCAELCLRHVEQMSQWGEDEKGYSVEHEDYTERDGHLIVIGLEYGAHGGDGTAAAYGCTRRNEIGCLLVDCEPPSQQYADDHDADDRDYGEQHPLAAALERFDEIHAESETHDRSLQQILGCFLVEFRIRALEDHCEEESQEECECRRDACTRNYEVERKHDHYGQQYIHDTAGRM